MEDKGKSCSLRLKWLRQRNEGGKCFGIGEGSGERHERRWRKTQTNAKEEQHADEGR